MKPHQTRPRHRAAVFTTALTVAVGAVVAFAGALVIGCAGESSAGDQITSSGSPADDRPRVAVRIAEVRSEPSRTRLEVTGVVASKSEVPLAFKIGGVVAEMLADEGQRVAREQVLARLELDEADGRLSQTNAALEQAQRDLERVRALHRDGAATTEELERTETAVRVARSQVEIAAFDHDYATIRSPVAGWVLHRRAEPGQLVGAAQPVLTVASAESGWVVRVGLADRDVVRIAHGDRADVELAALPGTVIPARVAQIAETVDVGTGSFEVELRLSEAGTGAEGRIKSGFVARATLAPAAGDPLPSVPVEALVRADGREGLVYGVDPTSGRFWPVAIAIDGFERDRLLVRDGLEEVGWVITDGAERLTRDSRLDIRTDGAQSPGSETGAAAGSRSPSRKRQESAS